MWHVIAGLILLASASENPNDPPADKRVMRALPRPHPAELRDNIVIVKNHLPPKGVAIPLPGGVSVKMVKESWECVAFYDQTIQLVFPFQVKLQQPKVTVVRFNKLKPAG